MDTSFTFIGWLFFIMVATVFIYEARVSIYNQKEQDKIDRLEWIKINDSNTRNSDS